MKAFVHFSFGSVSQSFLFSSFSSLSLCVIGKLSRVKLWWFVSINRSYFSPISVTLCLYQSTTTHQQQANETLVLFIPSLLYLFLGKTAALEKTPCESSFTKHNVCLRTRCSYHSFVVEPLGTCDAEIYLSAPTAAGAKWPAEEPSFLFCQ